MRATNPSLAFRPLRFLAATFFAAAIGAAVVHQTAPEQKFGQATIATDIEVRVMPRSAPTAETVRREALSLENLTTVYRRLKNGGPTSAAPDESAVSAEIGRWRRQLVVEVHAGGDPDRRRIRFLVEGGNSDVDARALVEATASLYAENLSAERWYHSVDRLRVAEDACDGAVRELSDAVARIRPATLTADRRDGPKLFSTDEPIDSVRREITRLLGIRAQLMETLQPAHPQILAVDNRLANLQATAAAMAPIRRLAAETETEGPSLAERDPIESAVASSSAVAAEAYAGLSAATAQLADLRSAVRQELDAILDPAAAEFPVLVPVVAGVSVWSRQESWYAVVGFAALILGLIAALVGRRNSSNAATIKWPRPQSMAMSEASTTTPERHLPPPPERVSAESLRDAEQVSRITAAPVLAVLRRRGSAESLTHA